MHPLHFGTGQTHWAENSASPSTCADGKDGSWSLFPLRRRPGPTSLTTRTVITPLLAALQQGC